MVTMLSFFLDFLGLAVVAAYWAGGPIILVSVHRLRHDARPGQCGDPAHGPADAPVRGPDTRP
ncbi:hypothetical protein [Leucobacter chromiireducens]|uniref:hypothetical protein n=1 Tax=Leucobacter chromiireducens TaxID=283877 RepID=UPI0013DE58ED|nr:hypothetical protein [Leucobacter chromiireducens]